MGRALRTAALVLVLGTVVGPWLAPLAADPWPRVFVFDSLDHGIACPAPRCVDGYWQEAWPADAVGLGTPAFRVTRAKWEVTPTGTSPAYQMRILWPSFWYFKAAPTYVWTLRAYGTEPRQPSALSNPTAPWPGGRLASPTEVLIR